MASLGLTVTDLHGWFGALQWRYFGPRPLIEDNSQRSASTALAYLRVGRQIDRSARLSVDVYNLFNNDAIRTYQAVYTLDNPATPAVEVNTWGNPTALLSPRFVRAQVTFDF